MKNPHPNPMSDYTLSQAEYINLKKALTRAINTKDPQKVIDAARKAKAIFEAKGYPDDWSRWERASDDATFALQRKLQQR